MPPSGNYPPGRLTGLQSRCNAHIANILPMLSDKQELYEDQESSEDQGHIAKWQGLSSSYGPIEHGPVATSGDNDAVPDATGRKPSDRTEDWDAFMPEIKQVLPFVVTVDDYASPAGLGFNAVFDFTLDGDPYRREYNYLQIVTNTWIGDEETGYMETTREWQIEEGEWFYVEPEEEEVPA